MKIDMNPFFQGSFHLVEACNGILGMGRSVDTDAHIR